MIASLMLAAALQFCAVDGGPETPCTAAVAADMTFVSMTTDDVEVVFTGKKFNALTTELSAMATVDVTTGLVTAKRPVKGVCIYCGYRGAIIVSCSVETTDNLKPYKANFVYTRMEQ